MIVDTLWATCSYCKNTTRHAKNTRAAKCGGVWRGEGGELAQAADEWGACEACPRCGEETIMEGGVNEQDEALVFFGK